MSRRVIVTAIVAMVAFGLGAGAGVVGFLWATGGLETESAPIESLAPTLSLNNPPPTPAEAAQAATAMAEISASLRSLETQINALATSSASISAQLAASGLQVPPTAQPDETNVAPGASEAAASAESEAGDVPARALYRISQDGSEVRFIIDEILGGQPNTVTARTRRVAGDIIIDFANPAASQLGQISINARTFRTDNEFRDDSIRGHILQTDTHEIITFMPTALRGLPTGPVSMGDTVEFQIAGDLTVKGVTRSVTFDAAVTLTSDSRVEGLARAAVVYQDFDITIRTPPLVSEVKDAVILEIQFVALRVNE